MFTQSRVAIGLAALALLGGLAAIYVPTSRVTADIDRALRQEDDVLADALKERLLLDAEEDVRALGILADAKGLDGLETVGEPMRAAVRVSAVLVTDAAGRSLHTYAASDTPGGISRTLTVKAMAAQAAATPFGEVARGFVLAYGQTYVAAAQPLPRLLPGGKTGVIFVFTRIEHAVMARLSEDYGLKNLDLTQQAPQGDSPHLPLYDASGRVTGYLTWQATSPAHAMLERLGPWIGGVVIAVGAILALLVAVTFRAHRKAATAALANQVLEKADRAKSLLFANLSHEFRTPLNAVIGFSDLMQRETFGPLGHRKYAEYIGDIHSSASHLLGLIEDVLILSRYEASDGITLNESVSLDEPVQDVVRMLAHQAAKKGLKLVMTPISAPDVLCSDKAIRQVAINLIGNAIKYTEAGEIRVSGGLNVREDGVELVVTDTGIGIPDEHIERVMRPFEQVDDVYARKQGGTGLGLSIVTSIVAHAGATMRIESRPGKGTRVTVTFRCAAVAAQPVPQAA